MLYMSLKIIYHGLGVIGVVIPNNTLNYCASYDHL